MSAEYKGQDPLDIAKQAERDLNSHAAKHGLSSGASSKTIHSPRASPLMMKNPPATESGVDDSITSKFPGSEIKVGSAASGAGDNREIPLDEGGELHRSGRYASN